MIIIILSVGIWVCKCLSHVDVSLDCLEYVYSLEVHCKALFHPYYLVCKHKHSWELTEKGNCKQATFRAMDQKQAVQQYPLWHLHCHFINVIVGYVPVDSSCQIASLGLHFVLFLFFCTDFVWILFVCLFACLL